MVFSRFPLSYFYSIRNRNIQYSITLIAERKPSRLFFFVERNAEIFSRFWSRIESYKDVINYFLFGYTNAFVNDNPIFIIVLRVLRRMGVSHNTCDWLFDFQNLYTIYNCPWFYKLRYWNRKLNCLWIGTIKNKIAFTKPVFYLGTRGLTEWEMQEKCNQICVRITEESELSRIRIIQSILTVFSHVLFNRSSSGIFLKKTIGEILRIHLAYLIREDSQFRARDYPGCAK